MKSFDQQVADWARNKPADEAYDYHQPCGCALHTFLTESGYPVHRVYAYHWRDLSGANHWFWDHGRQDHSKLSAALADTPWTFGALAERLSS
jgi:hypothetical protein